jgi:hypothetical protein
MSIKVEKQLCNQNSHTILVNNIPNGRIIISPTDNCQLFTVQHFQRIARKNNLIDILNVIYKEVRKYSKTFMLLDIRDSILLSLKDHLGEANKDRIKYSMPYINNTTETNMNIVLVNMQKEFEQT